MSDPSGPELLRSPRIRWAIYLACLVQILFTTVEYLFPQAIRGQLPMKDYDAFHVAGLMYWEGILPDAYRAETLTAAQTRLTGSAMFMPWTYPPHFNLLTAGLALLPVWLGYAFFTTASFAAYLWALRRLSGGHQVFVLLALFPALMICIRSGQNGFLTGALLAGAMVLLLAGRTLAGVPLALLTIKPHFLPGLGLYLLLRGQWRVIGLGCAVTAVLALVATAAFGPGIWADFRGAVGEAGAFLEIGLYPLYRMTSVYAFLFMQGASPALAMTLQIALGLGWLAVLVWAWRQDWPPRHQLATAVLGALFLSPYAYDYDLAILGVALALLAPDLIARASGTQLTVLVALCWLATGVGSIVSMADPGTPMLTRADLLSRPPSLGAVALLPLCVMALWIVRRRSPPGA